MCLFIGMKSHNTYYGYVVQKIYLFAMFQTRQLITCMDISSSKKTLRIWAIFLLGKLQMHGFLWKTT